MSQVTIYDNSGKDISKIKLSDDIFAIDLNSDLIHQAIVRQLANSRQSNAHTKTRGEVAGGGAKPWRQKGTGRARAGSTRSPIWIGGGTVFGPRNERNYSKMINKKMRQKAFLMALSAKASDKKLIIIKDFEFDQPKTKNMVELLNNLPIKNNSVLIVLHESNPTIEFSTSNLPLVKTIHISSLNILDLAKYEYLLLTEEGLKTLQERFGQVELESKES